MADRGTFENRSDRPARLLEIGPRTLPAETAHDVGLDLVYQREGRDIRFETRDGRPVDPSDEVEARD